MHCDHTSAPSYSCVIRGILSLTPSSTVNCFLHSAKPLIKYSGTPCFNSAVFKLPFIVSSPLLIFVVTPSTFSGSNVLTSTLISSSKSPINPPKSSSSSSSTNSSSSSTNSSHSSSSTCGVTLIALCEYASSSNSFAVTLLPPSSLNSSDSLATNVSNPYLLQRPLSSLTRSTTPVDSTFSLPA